MPVRGSSADSFVAERVVSQILTELDGLEELRDVVVIAATNRIDMVDPAILRPGRIDRLIEIPLPERETRSRIFEIHLRGKPLADEVSIASLVEMTGGCSGADIGAVCREAAMLALREAIFAVSGRGEHADSGDVKAIAEGIKIMQRHFDCATGYLRKTEAETGVVVEMEIGVGLEV